MELKKLSNFELTAMLTEIRLELQNRRTQKAQSVARLLTVGDEVKVDHDKVRGQILIVEKINPKKVKCKDKRGVMWDVPLSMIEPVITDIETLI